MFASTVSLLMGFRLFALVVFAFGGCFGRFAVSVVSRHLVFSVAFSVGTSRACGGFVFAFTYPSASYSDHSFELATF